MAPLMIPDADFSRKLGLLHKNKEHTLAFLVKGVEDFALPFFALPYGYRLVKSLNEDQYRLVAADETVYAVKLVHHRDITWPHPAVTQVMVWRTFEQRHQAALSGFPQRFFEWLLEQTRVVVSDSEQTGDGQRFWLTMISWAFSMGYAIYVADGTADEDWPRHRIASREALDEHWIQFAWGDDPEVHRHRRLIISKDAI
ncbi:hypothetical protein MF451_003743 [Salmonella enterica subsp. enterica serovar Saintpaul]|nr:hypothetical protein [Salmonella enterica subsp. enterica serovar Saintpaul]